MAITILPKSPGIAENFGTGLGQALSYLAQNKLQEIATNKQRAQTTEALKSMGISNPEQLSALPKELLQPIIKQQLVNPQNQAYLKLLQAQSGGQPGQAGLNLTPEEQAAGITPQMFKDITQAQREEKKLGLRSQEVELKKNKDLRSQISPYREKARSSEKSIRDYDEIIKLARSGKLRTGPTKKLLEKYGLDVFDTNLTTEMFQKYVGRLGTESATAFGPNARITNFLEKTYQQQNPSIYNTPQGVESLAIINKANAQAGIIEDREVEKLVKETNGNLPVDWEYIVKERSQPEKDAVQEQAMRDVEAVANKSNYKVVKTFDDKPSAKELSGRVIRNPETGNLEKSDGVNWIPYTPGV